MWCGSLRRLGLGLGLGLGRTTSAGLAQAAAAGGGRRGGGGGGVTRQARSSLLRAAAPVAGALCSSPGHLKTAKTIVCCFCTADSNVSYKELKVLLESKSIFLIDVREKWEIAKYGQIPGSVNIPLGEVMEALQMNQKHFKERYNYDMPSRADYLVFSCLAGVRSNQALVAAKSLGFNRTGHYAGGFKEWTEYESLGNK